jgi:tetrahydromethanopterin S-methyltransferase subunit G
MTNATTAERSFALGRRLTEITLGIDALGAETARRSGNDDYEDLVPIFIGEGLARPQVFAAWEDVGRALDDLASSVGSFEDAARKLFLFGMIRSLRASAKFFAGGDIEFEEKVRDLVGVPAQTVPDAEIDAIHARIDRLLARRGFTSGTLAQRVEAWQVGRYLDPDDIPAVFEHLMATAKERTDAMIWPTGDYTMRLNAVRDVPYAGRCSFVRGEMDINLDVLVTRSSLKHLVCHEVFPGHSTQLLSTLAVAKSGEAPLDALLCTTNAVTGAVQEGIGDQGIDLIDWVEDEDDAAQIELRRLQTATGTNAAWHLHCSGWTREASIAYLHDVGFGQRSWATVRTAMALHPFRGIFLASYWFGNETVKALREEPAGHERLVDALFREVHSIASLRARVEQPI